MAIGALALVKSVLALVLAVGGALRWSGPVPIYFAQAIAFSSAGTSLLVLGRRDRRAVYLGTCFLLTATVYADLLLRWPAVGNTLLKIPADGLRHVGIAGLVPFALWLFVERFPQRSVAFGRDHVARGIAGLALILGLVLIGSNLALWIWPAASELGAFRLLDRSAVRSAYWPLLFTFLGPALPYAFWKTRRAPLAERRRAGLLMFGIAVGTLPIAVLVLAEALSPRLYQFDVTPPGRLLVAFVVQLPLLSIPFTTAYAVLVHHALDVRLIVRKALQYAMARWTLVAVMAVPFAIVLVLVYQRREQSLAAVASGGSGLALLVLATTGALALRLRGQVLRGLDRRFFREQYDARAVLGDLVERSRRAGDVAELAALVPAEIDRALHVHSASLLLLDPGRKALMATAPGVPPLPVGSGLASRLDAGEIFEADWTRPGPALEQLAAPDKQWLAEADARLVVPVTDPRGTLAGAITLGEKRSELPFSREDRLLLRTIGDAVGLAIEGRRMQAATVEAGSDDVAAVECPDCGMVAEAGPARCERCGALLAPSPLPALLAGKYRPLGRIGEGGMGVVYVARDESLGREVALKTLPTMAPAEAARLRREARAMAAVSHPNLAAIHAAESWHGTPILVVELLRGGTLQGRLREGPMPAREALTLGIDVAAGLGALHAAGILHRDIKPSNIGFTADGTPKLLDFGLARTHALEEEAGSADEAEPAAGEVRPRAPELTRLTRTGGVPGTLPYLSPELARGEEPAPAADLWALSLVVYEAIAGRSPFAFTSPELILLRLSRSDVPGLADFSPGAPPAVCDFLHDCLHPDARHRPATARDWTRRARSALAALESAGASERLAPVPA